MEVRVERILRKGKKTARVLLSSGETVVMSVDNLPTEGSVYSTMTSSDGCAIRPLLPTDSFPGMLSY